MYTLTYTCKALTGTKIHTLEIDDDTLCDTWAHSDIGDVEGNDLINKARIECNGVGVDANVRCYANADGVDVVQLSLYTIYWGDDGYIHTNINDFTSCEIISIVCGDKCEQYSNDGKSFVYIGYKD